MAKINSCLANYSDASIFVRSFNLQNSDCYFNGDTTRADLVTTEVAPTLNIAKMAYGFGYVNMVVSEHLTALAMAMGATATDTTINMVAYDVINGFGYLKITEIILAIRMMREGKFRSGIAGADNRAHFFGQLTSDVVCDCLNRFCIEFRNPILDAVEQKRVDEEREKRMMNAATPEQRAKIIIASCVLYPSTRSFLLQFLNKKEMEALEYYSKERKALLLLKERLEEYLSKPQEERTTDALEKGIKYINDNFPLGTESIEVNINK